MRKELIGQNHHYEFSNMVTNVTKKLRGAEPSAAVHAAAGGGTDISCGDTLSAVASYSPATPIVVGTRGNSPRKVDPSLVVDYECELEKNSRPGEN